MFQLTPHIKYIGVDDENLDLFESQYPISKGISYNSYLVSDSGVNVVVDAVDIRRSREWLYALGGALPEGQEPDYLIIQHAEPDHSGSVAEFLKQFPSAKVVASAKAFAMLEKYFPGLLADKETVTIADGDTLAIGQLTLKFLAAPMVHWPEVMVTLCVEDQTLFSADAFGSFAKWLSTEAWTDEARRYYTNIVGRYGKNVQALLKKVAQESVRLIAPLHGPALTDNIANAVELYGLWSSYTPESNGTLVAYTSVYGNTALAARLLAQRLQQLSDAPVEVLDLNRCHVSEAVAQAFRFKNIALFSATMDAAVMPAMTDFLHHLKAKNLQSRRFAVAENGSWAPAARRNIISNIEEIKDSQIFDTTISIPGAPDMASFEQIDSLAQEIVKQC